MTISLQKLITFPFVRDAVADDLKTLHGLWTDIAAGGLEVLDAATGQFVALQ